MWTISNAISFLRLLLSVPLAFAIYYDSKLAVGIICVAALLSDNLDGYFARRMDQITEYGKIIDPLADKIFVGTLAVMMLINDMLPVWFAIVVLMRDVLILIGGLYLSKKLHYVVPSDYVGKGTVILISITLILLFFRVEVAILPALMIATTACFVSLGNYTVRMIKLIKAK